jgi:hypothetical protein
LRFDSRGQAGRDDVEELRVHGGGRAAEQALENGRAWLDDPALSQVGLGEL